MITVTRFDGSDYILNADLIEFIEARPDTHVSLITGKKLLVRETPQQLVDRVADFRRVAGPIPHAPLSLLQLRSGEDREEMDEGQERD